MEDLFANKELLVQGRRLVVHTAGSGTPLLLLHGGGADSALLSWGAIAPELAQSYRVILPNWPGYGGSEPRGDTLRSEDLPDIVEELRRWIGVERIRLVGISLGGLASVGYALKYPHRAERVAVFGCGGVQDRAPYHAIAWVFLHLPLLGRAMAVAQWSSFAKNQKLLTKSLKSLFPTTEAVPAELPGLVAQELQSRSDQSVFFKWQRDEIRLGGLKTNFTDRLPDLACPVLMIHGTKDIAVPVKYARRAASLIHDVSYHEIDGAGHWIPREMPETAAELLRGFFERVSQPPA